NAIPRRFHVSRRPGRRNGHPPRICHGNDAGRLYTATSLRAETEHPKFLVDEETRTRWWNSEASRKRTSWSGSEQSSQARGSPYTKSHRERGTSMEDRRPISCRTTCTTISDFGPSVRASNSSLL